MPTSSFAFAVPATSRALASGGDDVLVTGDTRGSSAPVEPGRMPNPETCQQPDRVPPRGPSAPNVFGALLASCATGPALQCIDQSWTDATLVTTRDSSRGGPSRAR